MPESFCGFRKCDRKSRHRFWNLVCPDSGWMCTYYTLCKELMKSSGGYGSTSLLFVIKVVMFRRFVSESHKVMAAIIVVLPSNCCCGGFVCNFINIYCFGCRCHICVMAKIHVGCCCVLTWFSLTYPFLSVILWFFLLIECYFVFSPLLFSMFSHCLLLVASQYHGWVFLLHLDLQLKCSSQVSGCINLYLL